MRQSRRRVLITLNDRFAIPTYTGSHSVFGNERKGYIECYSSGTLTFPKAGTIDFYTKDSGLAGESGTYDIFSYSQGTAYGGKGGGATYGKSQIGYEVTKEQRISIIVAGENGSTSSPNWSSFNGIQNNSYSPDVGGEGGHCNLSGSREDGKAGTDGTSIPFGVSSGIFYKRYGACGGGGAGRYFNWTSLENNGQGYGGGSAGGKGGTLGGGSGGGSNGTANTGSSGGGGDASVNSGNVFLGGDIQPKGSGDVGGKGGSGIVIVRWGY